ncbi:hypothetical protein MNBD_GAMMA11-3378 [hydrothermal vent metagenome]|uniref:YcgL domain-containing protein n=1 Tax=hydrothermal vent metagenome TaxID=652676 RepID=A0A3B0XAH9_9ZZZZ
MYIYLAEKNNFDGIDAALKNKLGELHFTMPLQLNKNTTLAREDPQKVIANLQSKGFHLQLPAAVTIEDFLSTLVNQK